MGEFNWFDSDYRNYIYIYNFVCYLFGSNWVFNLGYIYGFLIGGYRMMLINIDNNYITFYKKEIGLVVAIVLLFIVSALAVESEISLYILYLWVIY